MISPHSPAIQIPEVFFTLVFSGYVLVLLYFAVAWIRLPVIPKSSVSPEIPVTVLIPVRNEQENILACLNSIAAQDYPSDLIQVIVIDDSSTDQTAVLVEEYIRAGRIASLRLLSLKEDPTVTAHKKRALTEGVKAASGELILTTDGDCETSSGWVDAMVNCYRITGALLILGPVAFHREKNFFGYMQSLEFASLTTVTGATAFLNSPLMCNGASLAYPKKVFVTLNAYEGDSEPSGDDVMLMKKIEAAYPRSVCFVRSSDAIVYTKPQATLHAFLNQRRRWASKFSKYGKGKVAAIAILVFLCNFLFIAGGILCFILPGFVFVFLILAGAKLIIDFLILFLALSFSGRKILLWMYLPEVILYPFYVVLSGLGAKAGYEWKGRSKG